MRLLIAVLSLVLAGSAGAGERPVSVLDVVANFDRWKGRHISVECRIVDVGYAMVYCYGPQPDGHERIHIRTDNIDGEVRQNLAARCLMPGCRATVSGVLADGLDSGLRPILVKDIEFTFLSGSAG